MGASALVAVLVLRWLALGSMTPSIAVLVDAGAKVDERIAAGDWWRLVSAGWLHASLPHLVINVLLLGFAMLAWVRLGRTRGDDGASRTLAGIALATLASAVGFALSALMTLGASVGASGAAHGLLAAVVVGVWRTRGELPASLRRVAPIVLSLTFVAVVLVSSAGAQVDHGAHIGGTLAGIVLAPLVDAPMRARVVVIVVAGALVAAAALAALV